MPVPATHFCDSPTNNNIAPHLLGLHCEVFKFLTKLPTDGSPTQSIGKLYKRSVCEHETNFSYIKIKRVGISTLPERATSSRRR